MSATASTQPDGPPVPPTPGRPAAASSLRPDAPGFEQLARAVDEASAAAAGLDGPAREAAERLRQAVEAAHREALVTIVRRMREHPQARELLFELVDDPLIHLLLSLHGIIRPDPMVRGALALERIRPHLQARGGDAELVRIDAGTATVRFTGTCNGASLEALALREDVERALVAAVDAVDAVRPGAPAPASAPAGHPTDAAPTPSGPGGRGGPTLIPLSAVRVRDATGPHRDPGWVRTSAPEQVPEGEITPMRLVTAAGGEQDVIVVRLGGELSAYRDECAHQGLPLSDGLLDVAGGTITCRWHGYCYDARSGECMSAPGTTLERLPLRVEDGHIWIKAG